VTLSSPAADPQRAIIVETFRRTEIKHAICVRSFHVTKSFHEMRSFRVNVSCAEGPEPCAGVVVGGGAACGPGTLAVLLCVLSLVAQVPASVRWPTAGVGGRRASSVSGRRASATVERRRSAGVGGKGFPGRCRGSGQPVAGVGGGFQMLTDLTYIVPEQLPGVSFSSARSRRRYMLCWGMCAVVVSASWLS
jgi:hypothetical protein